MISKISLDRNETHLVPLVGHSSLPSQRHAFADSTKYQQIFIDTLHHFSETVALAQTISETYLVDVSTYTPPGVKTAQEFSAKYGEKLWETDEATYDYLVKVEPAARAYRELGVKAVITGRRRSQGADRASMPVLEVDERGLIKVNPLGEWTFKQVKEYVDKE